MKTQPTLKLLSAGSFTLVWAIILAACGSAFNGNFALQQSGGLTCAGSTSSTSSVNLVITQSGNTINGTGTGGCGAETLTGTANGTTISNATLIITSTGGAATAYTNPFYNAGNTGGNPYYPPSNPYAYGYGYPYGYSGYVGYPYANAGYPIGTNPTSGNTGTCTYTGTLNMSGTGSGSTVTGTLTLQTSGTTVAQSYCTAAVTISGSKQ